MKSDEEDEGNQYIFFNRRLAFTKSSNLMLNTSVISSIFIEHSFFEHILYWYVINKG